MDRIIKELGLPERNVIQTLTPDLFTVVVHNYFLNKLLKNNEVDACINDANFHIQSGESVPYPWRKVFVKVINKKSTNVLPLPRFKLQETNEQPLTFAQLLQYVSQNNQRNLWKEAHKKYCQSENKKDLTTISLIEQNQLMIEVILRIYSCNIIRIKTSKTIECKEIITNKYLKKSYDTHVNLLPALLAIETESSFFIIFHSHYENSLLDCLNFSSHLINMNYTHGLFIIYQLLALCKALCDRGLTLGTLHTQDIYMTENLWLQVVPQITNNVNELDSSLVYEYTQKPVKKQSSLRDIKVEFEKLCILWVQGQISNLDYLLHLNRLVGRFNGDPQTHFILPWVTDFQTRCGNNWRDLKKSKYRLTKGDRQLDMTYDVAHCPGQTPHHVTDTLSDITCYVYLARRTPKDVLCKYVRNKWVPAEYPSSIQRIQEWTPDECIPEFYTDPTVFKSIHEDLPDLGIPSWASCVEDFIAKHREALESSYVSENLHHWIDLTFGYKLSGSASVKSKNVCLSMVDAHQSVRRGCAVQLFNVPHPARSAQAVPMQPPRLYWTTVQKKETKSNESSEELTEDDESISITQHVSRLTVPTNRTRSRHKSSTRARSLSKHQDPDSPKARASSQSRHFKVQKSELGKGVIYLPKEFKPVSSIQAIETLDNFRANFFFNSADYQKSNDDLNTDYSDLTSYSNHMFLASMEQSYFRRFNQEQIDRKVNFSSRFVTNATVYKRIITESRKRDMVIVGCLIVEIFLHSHIRPLRDGFDNFEDRYSICRKVLKHNFSTIPKCVSYVVSLLLDVDLTPPAIQTLITKDESVVSNKGLPPPTPNQLLQPLLMQHLIPFPKSFMTLHSLLSTLHEYEVTSHELNILYTYQCDGTQCEKYQSVDQAKLEFSQRIAEGKIQACTNSLEVLLSQLTSNCQFDVLDIFLTHYIELLSNKSTSVLAAWYLFDTVSKSLGPEKAKSKLLKHILNLYEDDEYVDKVDSEVQASDRQKFVKLYHHIFLLQLMVRFGLQCFLENFTQHLVEAVGGYKDLDNVTTGHMCKSKTVLCKKLRYSDDSMKTALSSSDLLSPDTSFSSEHVTPNAENTDSDMKEDNRSENELFHFESERVSRTSRSKSPAESIESFNSNTEPSPQGSKEFTLADAHFDEPKDVSPEIPKTTFTSYINEDEDNIELSVATEALEETSSNKISDMSAESLIWLAHRLGPVLTCRYVTRNLLKMLTLCYIGKDNLSACDANKNDSFDAISIVGSRVVGDNNASKVIKCLTSIVVMYGEQLIVFQYLAHASELIACCRRRLSSPLEGGLVACLQLFKYLLPHMSDKKLMEQLQDTILKMIIHPSLRLLSTTRSTFPNGAVARGALARKLIDAIYALSLRVGREITKKLICVPALQRFFLIFDKAFGKIENWPKQTPDTANENKSGAVSSFVELCRDGSTAQWVVRGTEVELQQGPDLACSPPTNNAQLTAQEELLMVFNEELASKSYTAFSRIVGSDTIDRSINNADTVHALCDKYERRHAASPPQKISSPHSVNSPNDSKCATPQDQVSNSFGSNVTVVGNRIDVSEQPADEVAKGSDFDVVAYKSDGFMSKRHLRGDWLIYWEHEIGRPDKENRFNLKQIKLQTFVGHTHSVKSIHCLDNENNFMSGSKDKTVRLWSLKNQGDGNATTQCSWAYTGHKKGVLSLSFLESLRLAVSTDSVVHIWDPFMESVVNQLDHIKSPISIVRSLPGPSPVVIAATTDAMLKVIDARCCNYTHDLKMFVAGQPSPLIRSMCVVSGWVVCCGLNSGHVVAHDIRTGATTTMLKQHDSEILRLTTVDENRILSSSLDQTLALWNIKDGEIIAHLKGPTEPVHCMSVFHNELISGTTNNRIGVHTALHQDASFSSTKLRSDTLKGVLTCMSVLPMNRLLLLGSDNGNISMLC